MSNARVGIRRSEQEERNRLLFNELDDDQLTTVLLALRIARDSIYTESDTAALERIAQYFVVCYEKDIAGSFLPD